MSLFLPPTRREKNEQWELHPAKGTSDEEEDAIVAGRTHFAAIGGEDCHLRAAPCEVARLTRDNRPCGCVVGHALPVRKGERTQLFYDVHANGAVVSPKKKVKQSLVLGMNIHEKGDYLARK